MLTEYEALRRWVDLVSDTPSRFLDPEYALISNLVVHYGGSPAYKDTERNLIDKLAVALGYSASKIRRLTTNRVWFAIAEELQASPKRTDSTAMILNRIVLKVDGSLHGLSTPPLLTWDVEEGGLEWDVDTNAPVADV